MTAFHSKTFYVLDMGSHSLKLLGVNLSKKSPQILSFEKIPLPAQIGSYEKWETAITQIVSKIPAPVRKRLLVLLPNGLIFSRYVHLPHMPASKIKEIISFEAEQQIPFILEEVSWDYALLHSPEPQNLNVLISAIRSTELEKINSLFNKLSLQVRSYGITPLSLLNLSQFSALPEKNLLIIDMGHEVTHVLIIENQKSWGRSIPMGGSRLPAQGNTSWNLEAPEVKLFIQELIREIRKTFSFYASFSKEAKIGKVYLSGGLSYLEGIAALFTEEFPFPAELLDVSNYFSVGPSLKETWRREQRYFHTALGIILPETRRQFPTINLLSQADREKRELETLRVNFFSSLMILLLFLFAVFFNTTYQIGIKKEKLALAQQQISSYKTFSEHIDKILAELQIFDTRLKTIQSKNRNRYLFLQTLWGISKELPANIWFEKLHLNQDKSLVLTGVCSGTLADINFFKDSLEKNTSFSKVTIDAADITIEKDVSGKALRTFTIRLELA